MPSYTTSHQGGAAKRRELLLQPHEAVLERRRLGARCGGLPHNRGRSLLRGGARRHLFLELTLALLQLLPELIALRHHLRKPELGLLQIQEGLLRA